MANCGSYRGGMGAKGSDPQQYPSASRGRRFPRTLTLGTHFQGRRRALSRPLVPLVLPELRLVPSARVPTAGVAGRDVVGRRAAPALGHAGAPDGRVVPAVGLPVSGAANWPASPWPTSTRSPKASSSTWAGPGLTRKDAADGSRFYGSTAGPDPCGPGAAGSPRPGSPKAVFLRVDRHRRLLGPLSYQGVTLVKNHMVRLGHPVADFAGHSLRRGHATTAGPTAPASEPSRTTGHTSTQILRGYIEDGQRFTDPASQDLGCDQRAGRPDRRRIAGSAPPSALRPLAAAAVQLLGVLAPLVLVPGRLFSVAGHARGNAASPTPLS